MQAIVDKPTTFGILGTPNSGTSIINTFMNSFSNGFCTSEPLRAIDLRQPHYRLGKISAFPPKGYSNVLTNQYRLVKQVRLFDIGGLKETYQHDNTKYADDIINSNLIDFIILVFRNPMYQINSEVSHCRNVDDAVKSYKSFLSFVKDIKKSSMIVKYEELCDKGLVYLSDKLENVDIKTEGDLELVPNEFKMGHDKGNTSTKLDHASRMSDLLTNEQIESLKPLVQEYYEL